MGPNEIYAYIFHVNPAYVMDQEQKLTAGDQYKMMNFSPYPADCGVGICSSSHDREEALLRSSHAYRRLLQDQCSLGNVTNIPAGACRVPRLPVACLENNAVPPQSFPQTRVAEMTSISCRFRNL